MARRAAWRPRHAFANRGVSHTPRGAQGALDFQRVSCSTTATADNFGHAVARLAREAWLEPQHGDDVEVREVNAGGVLNVGRMARSVLPFDARRVARRYAELYARAWLARQQQRQERPRQEQQARAPREQFARSADDVDCAAHRARIATLRDAEMAAARAVTAAEGLEPATRQACRAHADATRAEREQSQRAVHALGCTPHGVAYDDLSGS